MTEQNNPYGQSQPSGQPPSFSKEPYGQQPTYGQPQPYGQQPQYSPAPYGQQQPTQYGQQPPYGEPRPGSRPARPGGVVTAAGFGPIWGALGVLATFGIIFVGAVAG